MEPTASYETPELIDLGALADVTETVVLIADVRQGTVVGIDSL